MSWAIGGGAPETAFAMLWLYRQGGGMIDLIERSQQGSFADTRA
ncbi:hypothetical protein [Loktanella sp. 5RATIMAR09]|nr:hypothetical protein [Loktanella sp. 5RATIMAR09]